MWPSLSFKEAEKKFIKKNSNQLFGGFENFETLLEKIKKRENSQLFCFKYVIKKDN